MSASRYKKLFHPKKSGHSDSTIDKEQIKQYQNLISKKLKDPHFAKKAAQIIEEMIKQKPNDHKKAS